MITGQRPPRYGRSTLCNKRICILTNFTFLLFWVTHVLVTSPPTTHTQVRAYFNEVKLSSTCIKNDNYCLVTTSRVRIRDLLAGSTF